VIYRRLRATGAQPTLYRGLTSETLAGACPAADFYFIDGGHSIETIQNDWQVVSARMMPHSVVIFDDYYHGLRRAGIGCNTVIDNLDPAKYEVTHLPAITDTGDLKIGMVKVTHADLSVRGREQSQEHRGAQHDAVTGYLLSDLRPEDVASAAGGGDQLERITATQGA
jgi:hypothetical protein